MSPEELQKYVTVVSPLFDKIGQSGEKLLQLASNYGIAQGVGDIVLGVLFSAVAGGLLYWALPEFKRTYYAEKSYNRYDPDEMPSIIAIVVAVLFLFIAAFCYSAGVTYLLAPEVCGLMKILGR